MHLSLESQLAQTTDAGPVVIFAHEEADSEAAAALASRGIEVINQQSSVLDLAAVLQELGRRSIQGVLVEGGPLLAGLLLEAGLVDKVTFFIAPIIIGCQDAPSAIGGSGVEKVAEAPQLERVETKQHGRDVEITGYPKGSLGP